MRVTEERAAAAYRACFGSPPAVIASAPGRVNLIGEHTDYNAGFVLPCAIEFRVAAAAGEGKGGLFSAEYGELESVDGCQGGSWAAYPRGVAWALTEAGNSLSPFQAAVAGDVPRGAGLSSSAAIEAAIALALDTLDRLHISRPELASLCQRAENGFVGVNSGIMDQYASLLCREGAALLIDCRTLEARPVPLDLATADLALLICDTRVERRLAASGYNDRRATTERAAKALGVEALRDATLEDLRRLQGVEQRRARHVVSENGRVLEAVDALERDDFRRFGRLMYASHDSLRDDYEVSTPELDTFVQTARESDALGARLTGAGFGGCAIALVRRNQVHGLMAATRARFAVEGFTAPAFYPFQPSAGAEVVQSEV